MKVVKFPWADVHLSGDPCFGDPRFEQENFERVGGMRWPPGSVFLDVGAHQGIWTTFLASLADKAGWVHSFEPHPENVPYLTDNIARVGAEGRVTVHQTALGSKPETKALRCWKRDKVGETGNHQFVEGDAPDYTVAAEIRTLDSYELPRVDFVKIDVEHWEMEVLRGATETLKRCRPRVLVETHSIANVVSMTGLCEDLGLPYEFWWASVPNIDWRGRYLFINPDGLR